MNKKDAFDRLMFALNKRDWALRQENAKIGTYNRYLKVVTECANELIEQGRQDEMLPLLENKSVSIMKDAADALYACYPEICGAKLKEISRMTVKDGLEKCYVLPAVSAAMAFEYGDLKDKK